MCPQHCGSLSLSYDVWAAVRWRPMPKMGYCGAWSPCPTSENFSTNLPPPSPWLPPDLPPSLLLDVPQSQPHLGPSLTPFSQRIPGWSLELVHWEEFPLMLCLGLVIPERNGPFSLLWSVHKTQMLTNIKVSKPTRIGPGAAGERWADSESRIY